MSITTADGCPQCSETLTVLPHTEPWCAACEWNLDAFPADADLSWFWRRILTLDRRAGFRAHRRLAVPEGGEAGTRRAYRTLVFVSALIVLADLVVAGFGIWLLIWGDLLFPKLGGLILVILAWVFRPRLGRFRGLLDDQTYIVEPRSAPTLHRLVVEIAAEVGAPVPDRILIDHHANAATAVVGLRRTSVLTLGVRLLLALSPQETVALIGHELGHLKYEDSTRALLTQPARTAFGRLSLMVRPRAMEIEAGGFTAVLYLLLRLAGGLLSLVLASVHTWLAVLAADDQRRVELRADAMAARAAGSAAALSMMDVTAMVDLVVERIQPWVPRGEAGVTWRRLLGVLREQEAAGCAIRRQLTIRFGASLLADHPPAGRRYQWLAGQPARPAGIEVDPSTADLLEREINVYAEALHRRMTDHPAYWQG